MAFPVAAKDSLVTLRAKGTFIGVGILYSILTLGVSVSWFTTGELSAMRDSYSRPLFYGVLLGGIVFYSFHAALFAARSLVREREEGTADLLRTSPLSPTAIVFQKMLTPFGIEWLFLFGSLPFVSLVFLLGGIGFAEILYQIVNLGFWLNTCVLIGLRASAKAKASEGVERKAGLWLLFLGVGPFLLVQIVKSLTFALTRLDLMVESNFFQLPVRACELLSVVTPFWMVISWTASESVGDPMVRALIPFTGVFPRCPALLAWLLHLLLQAFLFASAVRAWKRKPDSEAAKPLGAQILQKPRKPLDFGEGWRIFEQLEGASLKRVSIEPAVWALLALGIMVLTGLVGPYATSAIGTLMSLAVLWIVFGVAANSFRKERSKGTTLFLLCSPFPMKDVFLGKWMFYLKNLLKWTLFGFVTTLPMYLLYILPYHFMNQFAPPPALSTFGTFPVLAVSLPLTCLIGVGLGLYPNLSRWAIPVGVIFFCCGGANCGGIFALIFLFIAARVLFVFAEPSLFTESLKDIQWRTRAKRTLLFLIVIDILGAVIYLLALMWLGGSAPGWNAITTFLYAANILLIPLCLAETAWVWIYRKPDRWWREKLLPGTRGKFVSSGG
jgi:ABC-type transport system involved in multi-copper enzyme maturation permease subunit